MTETAFFKRRRYSRSLPQGHQCSHRDASLWVRLYRSKGFWRARPQYAHVCKTPLWVLNPTAQPPQAVGGSWEGRIMAEDNPVTVTVVPTQMEAAGGGPALGLVPRPVQLHVCCTRSQPGISSGALEKRCDIPPRRRLAVRQRLCGAAEEALQTL